MTEQLELKIPHDEVTRISIQCQCGTETIVDISKEIDKDFYAKWETKNFRCGLCSAPFDSNIKMGIADLISWYQRICAVNDSRKFVFFQIRKTQR